MAWQVSKRVWEHATKIKLNYKVMLLALADKADENGICWPKYDTSYKTLGEMVGGLDRRSAMRLIDNLVEAGHVVKRETVGRGNSNIFLVITGLSEAEKQKAIALIGDNPVTITNEESKGEQKEMVTTFTLNGDNPVTNSGLNGDNPVTQSILKTPTLPIKRKKGIPPISEKAPVPDSMFVALAKVCQIDLEVAGRNTKGLVGQSAQKLSQAGNLPADFEAFEPWWYAYDWRGKKQEPPTPPQVCEVWGQFKAFRKKRQPDPVPDSAELPPVVPLTPDEQILERFKERAANEGIPPVQWKEHIAPMRVVSHEHGKIQVRVDPFSLELIERKFYKVLEPIAEGLSPGGFEYVVV